MALQHSEASGGEELSEDDVDELVGSESERDADAIPLDSLRDAVVTGTDWTVATLLDQLRRGNIDLAPNFQRRGVWQQSRKSRFVESLVLGLPIPQIVLAEKPGERGRFLVLDGKQRLLAIRQFCAEPDRFVQDDGFSPSKLNDMTLLPFLNGKSYQDLRDEPGLVDYRDAFDNNPVRTVIVRNWPTPDYLYLVFLRLNTGSVPLSPQELRQALQPGPFTDFVERRSLESAPLQRALNLKGPDFRMRDTEILLRAISFDTRAAAYSGNMKQFLDQTCEIFNASWAEDEDGLNQVVDEIESAIQVTIDIFGPRNAFSRYTDGEPERRFNRAVFDVMVSALRQPGVADRARAQPDDIVSAFAQLCSADSDFVQSIATTTKSIEATKYRFETWSAVLSTLLAVPVVPPAFR